MIIDKNDDDRFEERRKEKAEQRPSLFSGFMNPSKKKAPCTDCGQADTDKDTSLFKKVAESMLATAGYTDALISSDDLRDLKIFIGQQLRITKLSHHSVESIADKLDTLLTDKLGVDATITVDKSASGSTPILTVVIPNGVAPNDAHPNGSPATFTYVTNVKSMFEVYKDALSAVAIAFTTMDRRPS